MFQIKNIRYPTGLFSLLIILVMVALNFEIAIKSGMHQTVSEPSNWYLRSICGAISSAKYGRGGYVCCKKVYDKLSEIYQFVTYSQDAVRNPQAINQIIKEAQLLNDPGCDRIYTMGENDSGYVDYCRLAFTLFGYKIESLFSLYFILFSIVVLNFYLSFRRNNIAIVILILYLLAHFMILKATRDVGYNLSQIHSYRGMPVLAVLPLLQVYLMTLFKRPFSFYIFLGVLIQAVIFTFVLWTRSSMLWMVIFLLGVAVVNLFFILKKRIEEC